MRVLIIEDDKKIASFVERGLREDGYAVDVAHDGQEGLTNAHVYDYDALIIDIMVPTKNGFEIVRDLRSKGRHVPVLLLTARDSQEDIVMGLDAGADDYVTKPFKLGVLLARLRALIRRGGAGRTERLVYGTIEVDRLAHEARLGGKDLGLTPKEFQLLEFFVLRPEQVVRRTELLENVWDLQFDPETNVVDVHVGHLRRKLTKAGPGPTIQTLRGVGYMLVQAASGE
jgi:DNA-binding response OmpR family regulator